MEVLSGEEWKLLTHSINAYMIPEAIYAGCELDIFSHIENLESPTLANIAAAIGLNEYPCSILLMCLCCSGLISKEAESGLYENHTAARKALCSKNHNNFIPFVRFNYHIQQKGLSHFLNALKSEKNEGLKFLNGSATSLYDRFAENPGMTELFHEAMAAYTHFGPKIVYFEEMRHCKKLLDIGGGNGSVSQFYLSENPYLHATVLDLESVCKMGQLQNDNKHNRLQFVAGDLFTCQWNFQQDAILFSHLLEIFSEDKVKFLYQKAFDHLPLGGRLFIWTIISNETETGSLQAAKSSAYFLTMASGEGKAYSKNVHIQHAKSAGFVIDKIYDKSDFDHLGLVLKK